MGQNTHQFEITVLTGLNSGVELEMASGRHSIGGMDTDDIQLDGLTETLADFVFERDTIKLKPRVSTISTKPGGELVQGRVTRIKLPARISLTPEIDIFAGRIAVAAPKRKLMKPILALAGMVLFAIGLTAVQIDFKFNSTQATPSAPKIAQVIDQTPSKSETMVQAKAVAKPTCSDCPADAAADLQKNLAKAGILGLVVTSNGGAVRVEGGLSADNRRLWSGVRSAFDGKWPMVPMLTSFTESKNGAPLSIASVWLGEPREIKTAAGETLKIGDIIHDGWRVSEIEQNHVELVQGETVLRVTY